MIDEYGISGRMRIKKLKYLEETYPNAAMFIINPT
jgi:hypothetical protein